MPSSGTVCSRERPPSFKSPSRWKRWPARSAKCSTANISAQAQSLSASIPHRSHDFVVYFGGHFAVAWLEMTMTTGPAHSVSQVLSRRQLLQVGGVGLLDLGLPDLLHAASIARGGRTGSEKSCIFIVQYGGASHIDSFDLKPDAPAEMRGPFKPSATNVPGVRICELMP